MVFILFYELKLVKRLWLWLWWQILQLDYHMNAWLTFNVWSFHSKTHDMWTEFKLFCCVLPKNVLLLKFTFMQTIVSVFRSNCDFNFNSYYKFIFNPICEMHWLRTTESRVTYLHKCVLTIPVSFTGASEYHATVFQIDYQNMLVT